MNVEQAKQLSLPVLMSRLGYEPIKSVKGGYELWYQSPFRKEKEPSFHTSYLGGQWIWNDFADCGGTIIDFVLRHENMSRVSEALKFLSNFSNIKPRKRQQRKDLFSSQQHFSERQLEFIEAKEIEHPAILQYLIQTRKIDEQIAKRYFKEIWYRNKVSGKEYFGFGMQNQSGGWEVRSAQDEYPFKSALINRDITIIPGFKPHFKFINIFEGMTDFVSLLTLMKTDQFPEDSIVLHSLSSLPKAIEHIEQHTIDTVYAYLDNNPSGKKGLETLISSLSMKVSNESSSFLPHEDLNDFLISLSANRNRAIGTSNKP